MSLASFVIVHKDFPLSIDGVNGGAETATLGLAKALSGLGYRVVVGAPLVGNSGFYNGVNYCDLGEHYDVFGFLQSLRGSDAYHLLCASRMHGILASRNEPECLSRTLIAHDSHVEGIGLRAAVASGIADHIVVLSQEQKQRYVNAGADAAKLRVVPNGIDHDVFYPPRNDAMRQSYSLVYSGALVPDKGIDILLAAFRLVRERITDVTLDIFGSARMWGANPQYEKELIAQAPGGVTFYGEASQFKVADKLRQARLSIHPSLIPETFSLSSIEAQACGCPVVAFDSGGIKETLLAQKTGVVVKEKTAPTGFP